MLDATTVTEAAPGGTNCDFLLVAADWALVLDGVSAYPVADAGCRHGIPWFVAQLGTHLGAALAQLREEQSLPDALADAIRRTADDHGSSCDLTHPLTPAATVAAVRLAGDRLDWLVLGDATVAWQLTDESANAVTDDRADRLVAAPIVVADVRRYDPEYVAKVRNQPGGFWVAAATPDAASQALVGSHSADTVTRVGLYSDGVTRLVERYGWTWARMFAQAQTTGARTLIAAVREAEGADPDPTRWRGKPYDDATAVIASVVPR